MMHSFYLPIVAGKQRDRLTVCSGAQMTRDALNLATYNVGYEPDAWAMAPVERVGNIVRLMLGDRDAEIIALQEVMYEGERAELPVFVHGFRGWQWFSVPHNRTNHYCNLLLSRYPIIPGSERTHTIHSAAGRKPRVNISVQVASPAGAARVYSIHTRFEEPDSGTRQTMEWVAQVVEQEPKIPYALMGDFNTQRKNVLEIAKDAGLRLQSTRSGRIDHILLGGAWAILEDCSAPLPSVPGEHDPLFATVRKQ